MTRINTVFVETGVQKVLVLNSESYDSCPFVLQKDWSSDREFPPVAFC